MADTVFREQSTEAEARVEAKGAKPDKPVTDGKAEVEPPFLDYENVNGHPYLVDHFGLGDSWQDRLGGFSEEIETINDYLANQIKYGRLDNSVEAVKKVLKKMEKMCGAEKTERVTMRIEKMAAYSKFLSKTEDINYSNYKYGNR